MAKPHKHVYSDLGNVIKSPLDTNDYKVIKLCSNGLVALLVSTCEHPLEVNNSEMDNETCIFNKLRDFNAKYVKIGKDTNTDTEVNPSLKSKTSQSSTTAAKSETSKPSGKKRKPKKAKGKIRCMKGIADPDDQGQDNRNNIVAVALLIGSGMLDDPPDVPGMAHFVEHCVFLGSENYPDIESFQTFIQDNDGDVNAGTDAQSTSFRFTVGVDKIDEALEIFTDLMINPLFDSQRVTNEINAMNSEFVMNKLKDDFRYMLLLRSFANDCHPMSNFSTGNRESLGKVKDLHKRLLEWQQNNYKAKNMVFAIQGPMPVDKLAKLVVEHCGKFPTCNCMKPPRKRYEHRLQNLIPIDPIRWNKMTYVVPILDEKWIRLGWVLQREAASAYETKPNQFLGYLFTSKVKGSLDYYLRNKGWLLNICCTCPNWRYLTTTYCTLFVLTLHLTENGMKNKTEVVKSVFSYIQMLKNSSKHDLERIFNEMKQISADIFHFRSDVNITDPVNDFSYDPFTNADVLRELIEVLIDGVCPTKVLTSKLLTSKFDEELINSCIENMNPRNTNFMIGSIDLLSECSQEEDLFKTKYSPRNIKESFLKCLENIKANSEFYLPPPNKFIESSLCYPLIPTEKLELKDDIVLLKNEKMYIDYSNKDCQRGFLPSAAYRFFLSSKRATKSDYFDEIPLTAVWIKCLNYLLDLKLAHALSALINYNLSFDEDEAALVCFLGGPSERLPEIFDIIIQTINNFEKEITEAIYINMSQCQIRHYNNSSVDSETFATDLKAFVVERNYILPTKYASLLRGTSFKYFLGFVEDFKYRMFMEIFLSGCVSKSDAKKLLQAVSILNYRPWSKDSSFTELNRAIKLPLGERCLRVKARSESDNTHVISNHYQSSTLTPKERIIVESLIPSFNSFSFEQLRTKEQLAYFVEVEYDFYHTVSGITITVRPEADLYTPDYIDERIDAFLEYYFKEVILKKQNYLQHIDPFIAVKDKVKQSEVITVFETYFLPCGPDYRKLSVQIMGSSTSTKVKPKTGKRVPSKMIQYRSGKKLVKKIEEPAKPSGNNPTPKKLPFTFAFPYQVTEENGYFITDILTFKHHQHCFGNLSRSNQNTY